MLACEESSGVIVTQACPSQEGTVLILKYFGTKGCVRVCKAWRGGGGGGGAEGVKG